MITDLQRPDPSPWLDAFETKVAKTGSQAVWRLTGGEGYQTLRLDIFGRDGKPVRWMAVSGNRETFDQGEVAELIAEWIMDRRWDD